MLLVRSSSGSFSDKLKSPASFEVDCLGCSSSCASAHLTGMEVVHVKLNQQSMRSSLGGDEVDSMR